MKSLFTICLSLLLISCNTRDREIDQLNQRIARLEQRVDSLLSNRNAGPVGLNNIKSAAAASYSTTSTRCQALTKKGSQCRRKGNNNSNCWQHGG